MCVCVCMEFCQHLGIVNDHWQCVSTHSLGRPYNNADEKYESTEQPPLWLSLDLSIDCRSQIFTKAAVTACQVATLSREFCQMALSYYLSGTFDRFDPLVSCPIIDIFIIS